MKILAQYDILSDSSFTLQRGDEQRLRFNPENDVYLEDTKRRAAILMYTVDPSENTKSIEIEVWARLQGKDERISVLKVNGGHLRTVTEPINPERLSVGDNRITFKVVDGVGSIRFSNVIMWYQRRVTSL